MDVDVIVTSHAKKRIKKRLGLNKSIIEDVSREAFFNGIQHKDLGGSFKRYVSGLYLKYGIANNIRIYKEKVFIFRNNVLITVFNLPHRYKRYL